MKLGKVLIISAILVLTLITSVYAAEPEITATSSVVIDCIDGKILYSKNMKEKLYPASLTNVLTAILVVENCNMQDNVTISQNAVNSVQTGYLTANIAPGEVLTVEQLLNLILISSYNDVANALAEHVAGSKEQFVEMMNQKAKEIGCENSNFVNNTGEHDSEHYSTAYDMALIGKYAMKYDVIKEIIKKTKYTLPVNVAFNKPERTYYTTNEMLLTGSGNYYKYGKGLKTAFTTPAGYCLMAYAEKKDIPLVAVTMKSTTSDSRYEDAKKVLEYAYDNNVLRTIATEGTTMQTLNIKKGTQDTKKLNAVVEKNIVGVVKAENENSNIEAKVTINEGLKAPIEKWTVIGEAVYEIEGKEYKTNLVAETNVEKSHTGLIFLLIFIGLIILLGGLKARAIYKRKKVLKKIRGK